MKFVLGIKPTIITDHGTTRHALLRFRQSIRGCFCYGPFGNAYVDNAYGDTKYVYGYNIEVFKRGKYRKNKHYVIYKYTFPVEMFRILNLEINQGTRTFKITPKKNF